MKPPSARLIKAVLGASVVSTAIHYTDNYVYVDEYPQPGYINRELIVLAWVLLTLIGIAGYLFYRDGRRKPAAAYLLVYSYAGLSSLGHYAFEGRFSTKIHALIWMDGIAGAAVALCSIWLFLAARRHGLPVRLRPR